MSRRSLLRWGVGAAVLAAVLVSPHLGQADPSGSYRPDLPPDALTSGCYPLPDGVVIDQSVLPHQVRSDGDVGDRRVLVGQWDLVGETAARERIVGAFEGAGFTETDPGLAGGTRLTRPDVGPVVVRLRPLPDVPADSAVRGTFVLDLPPQPLAPGRESDEACLSPFSTKRFPTEGPTP